MIWLSTRISLYTLHLISISEICIQLLSTLQPLYQFYHLLVDGMRLLLFMMIIEFNFYLNFCIHSTNIIWQYNTFFQVIFSNPECDHPHNTLPPLIFGSVIYTSDQSIQMQIVHKSIDMHSTYIILQVWKNSLSNKSNSLKSK